MSSCAPHSRSFLKIVISVKLKSNSYTGSQLIVCVTSVFDEQKRCRNSSVTAPKNLKIYRDCPPVAAAAPGGRRNLRGCIWGQHEGGKVSQGPRPPRSSLHSTGWSWMCVRFTRKSSTMVSYSSVSFLTFAMLLAILNLEGWFVLKVRFSAVRYSVESRWHPPPFLRYMS